MAKRKRPTKQLRLRLKKVPISGYLEPRQALALRALSASTRVPQQEYIREGVEYVLAKYGRGAK